MSNPETLLDSEPRDEHAEASVLGAALLSRTAAAIAVESLIASEFYVPKHGLVFDAVRALVSRSEPVDAITVGDELQRTDSLAKVGGPAFLHQLAGDVPTASNVEFYVEIVRDRAVARRLLGAGLSIVRAATGAVADVDALVESARAEVDSVSPRVHRHTGWVGDDLAALWQELSNGEVQVESTGWGALDSFIGGFRPGDLYVLGARPGVGKSVVALNLAASLAGRGHTVGFASLEMSKAELEKRLLSAEASVHLAGMLDANLSASDWDRMNVARERIAGMRLAFYDAAASLSQVLSFARTMHREGKLGLLVVDYLQLLTGDGKAESRQVEVSQFSRSLKLLARELHIPVLALSQLNRESAGRKGGEPRISDLRESGSLEQDASVVLLLHRDEERAPSKLKVIVAKNRHGRSGEATLQWEGRFARAVEMPWSPTALLNERGQ